VHRKCRPTRPNSSACTASCPTRRTCSRTSSRYAETTASSISPYTRLTPLQERKYFDSGDYALSKAGKAGDVGVTQVGREHPNPEKIPHIAPPTPTGQNNGNGNGNGNGNASSPAPGDAAGSPVKEHTFLHRETSLNRETSASDFENEAAQQTSQ
jgi:hypothetical protein